MTRDISLTLSTEEISRLNVLLLGSYTNIEESRLELNKIGFELAPDTPAFVVALCKTVADANARLMLGHDPKTITRYVEKMATVANENKDRIKMTQGYAASYAHLAAESNKLEENAKNVRLLDSADMDVIKDLLRQKTPTSALAPTPSSSQTR